MLKNNIRKELTELWREGRIKWLSVILMLLLVTTTITSFRYSRSLKKDHEMGMQADRNVWENQRPKNPHGAAHFGFYLFKPVSPLAVFEPGIDRFTGSVLYLEAHQRNNEQFPAIGDESDLARFGFLSPAFILQYLLPLLIVVAGFNLISKERENGNAGLLLSQGVPAKKLFAGKWLSLFLLVACIMVPGFLLSLTLLAAQQSSAYHYAAAGCMLFLYLLFYGIVINVVLLISNRAKQSGRALLYGVLFWMLSSVLTPKLVAGLSDYLSPLLTNDEIVNKIKEYNKTQDNVHDKTSGLYKHMVDSLLKRYNADSISQLPVNVSGVRLDIGEQADTRNYERVMAEQMKRLAKQQQIITAGSLFSPLVPTQQLSMALANTDVYSHHHFNNAGERYRREFVNIMNRYIAYESGVQESSTSFKAGPDLWKRVPVFTYHPPGFSMLKNYAWPAVALLVWFLLSGFMFSRSVKHFKAVRA